jgi:uncharacterized damage-inducible protein DinB
MTGPARLNLDVGRFWESLQGDLLRAANLFPEEQLSWTPREGLWNARGILIHVSDVRDQWLANGVRDGDPYPNIWQTARTKDDLMRELVRTYERLTRFITNATQLDATYAEPGDAARLEPGHWLAFQLLEHDIHHRAELLQRLALLGIEHGIDL